MSKIKTILASVVLTALASAPLSAQIVIAPYTSAMSMAQALINTPSITINSATYTGASTASGFFSAGVASGLPFSQGIVLTTGSATNVVGPNTSTSMTTSNGLPGTADIGGYDGSTLTINFTPTANVISFQYAFASEEYPEYAGSSYNDMFKFMLNGVNIALIPSTVVPVSINSINQNTNSQYYRDNTGGALDTQMDGLIGINPGYYLYATGLVNVGVQNIISIQIADIGDDAYDSAVFLGGGSFNTTLPPTAVPEPSTYGLIGALALMGMVFFRRMRK